MNPVCTECQVEARVRNIHAVLIEMHTRNTKEHPIYGEPHPYKLYAVNSYYCPVCGRKFVSCPQHLEQYAEHYEDGFMEEYERVLKEVEHYIVYEYPRQSPNYKEDE